MKLDLHSCLTNVVVVTKNRYFDNVQELLKGYEYTRIVNLDLLKSKHSTILTPITHLIIAGGDKTIREGVLLALKYGASIGIVPLREGKLSRSFQLPKDPKKALKMAFSPSYQSIDVLKCNNTISIYSCEIGDSPVTTIHNNEFDSSLKNRTKFFYRAFLNGFKLQPFGVKIKTKSREIDTVATSIIVIENDRDLFASNLVRDRITLNDGKVSLMIVSPLSILEYFSFIFQSLSKKPKKVLPQAISFVKSDSIEVTTWNNMTVHIDEVAVDKTPVKFSVNREKLRVALPQNFFTEQKSNTSGVAKESLKIENLPDEKERERLLKKKLEFFTRASENRHNKLFTLLRRDAKFSYMFSVLMILSSTLATLGLFLNSASVIIGAMVLAPLMAPIISLSMALLRQDDEMSKKSARTIFLGIFIAILVPFIISEILPMREITDEISSRINPTILDFFVAFISGMAGAYAKANEKVAQNIAGVAIAVAIVPPICVAGIGLGWSDSTIFIGALLLFLTNLFGIIFSASITFVVMGFSSLFTAKRGVVLSLIFSTAVIIPLLFSFVEMLNNIEIKNELTLRSFSFKSNREFKFHNISIYGDRVEIDIYGSELPNSREIKVIKESLKSEYGESFGFLLRFEILIE